MIDILVPTLGRPRALEPLLANVTRVTPQGDFRVIFVADERDTPTLEVLRRICGRGVNGDTFLIQDGTYPEKTNAAYRFGSGDLVLPTADDGRFHPGWLQAALAALENPAVQVVGTDDLSPATESREHATMPIVRRSYIEDPGAVWGETGTVFHAGYRHNFCETELWQLAVHRGVTAWAEGSVIEHLHPAWGKRDADETDRKGNQQGWEADETLFRARQRQWSRS